MRPIISKDEAERLIQSIPGIRAQAYYNRTLHELTEHYEASLKTHNCTDLIELCMSIYAKKTQLEEQKRKFGSIDERYMKRAEELLFGELAAALCIPKEQMPGYIARIINERRWNY
jgi:CarD family transcriptional regulator